MYWIAHAPFSLLTVLPSLNFALHFFLSLLHMLIVSGSTRGVWLVGLFGVSTKGAHSFSQAHAYCSHDHNLTPAEPLVLSARTQLVLSVHHCITPHLKLSELPSRVQFCCQSSWSAPPCKSLHAHQTRCWEGKELEWLQARIPLLFPEFCSFSSIDTFPIVVCLWSFSEC